MLLEKTINYLSWLESRGLNKPTFLSIQNCLVEETPKDKSIQQESPASIPVASVDLPEVDDSPAVATEPDSFANEPTLIGRQIVLVAKALPRGAEMQMLTRLMIAMKIRDSEFRFVVFDQNQESSGTQLIAAIANQSGRHFIIFSEDLAVVFKSDNHPVESGFTVLGEKKIYLTASLRRLLEMPQLKRNLWDLLKEI